MDEPQTIAAGDIVSGLEPSELVEVRRVAPFGAKTLVEGITLQTKHEIKRPLSTQELAQIVKVRSQAHSFDGDPEVFLLGAEAACLRFASALTVQNRVARKLNFVLAHGIVWGGGLARGLEINNPSPGTNQVHYAD